MKYEDDGFDPTPYDRILSGIHTPARESEVLMREKDILHMEVNANPEENKDQEDIQEREDIEQKKVLIEQNDEIPQHEQLEKQEEDSDNDIPVSLEPETGPGIPEAQRELPEVRYEPIPSHSKATASQLNAGVVPDHMPHRKDIGKVIPIGASIMSSELKFTDIREKEPAKVHVQEDILVPDIKPDLASILYMDGTIRLSDKEIKVSPKGEDLLKLTGEIALQTIYIPEGHGTEPIVTIQSKIPFRSDWSIGVSPLSNIVITPVIESIDFTVINERKFRAKITVLLTMTEYADMEMEFFEGIRGEEVQLLKEKIKITDILYKKCDTVDIHEELPIKEATFDAARILKYDINIVENHKQLTPEKAVINASIYCNVMYLKDVGGEDEEVEKAMIPALFQGKTEFTQFIPLSDTEGQAGSRLSFDAGDLTIKIKEAGDEDDDTASINGKSFFIEGTVGTCLEVYRNIEKEVVTDVYHSTKEISYDGAEMYMKALVGSSVTEISSREILNIPEKYSEVDRVIYISGKIKNSQSMVEQGKNIVTGNMLVELLCIAGDEGNSPFKMSQEIAFRGTMDIPGVKQGMIADNHIYIKDLWFDKINNKQIEVNAGLFISSDVSSKEPCKIIKNVSFVEGHEETGEGPAMIIYVSKPSDNLWKIAKKFRTTIEVLSEINGLGANQKIEEGSKLLIVK